MQTVNFSAALENDGGMRRTMARRALSIDEAYRTRDGVQYRASDGSGRYFHEVVRLDEGAILMCTDAVQNTDVQTRQIVTEDDWLHIQFRLSGEGQDKLAPGCAVEIPDRSCVVARYPENSIIERRLRQADRWKFVCLYMRPAGLTRLLDIVASDLPENVSWLATTEQLEARARVLPLQPAMIFAANDIMSCSFGSVARRAYMRAKSIELLSSVIQTMAAARVQPDVREKLSTADLKKIAQAHALMIAGTDARLTLAELARRVGLNRSKLAFGFKQVYGQPVLKFWRDASLERARKLLQEGASVTDVAWGMGYSDPYSFTRAFVRKFGSLPRDCKNI